MIPRARTLLVALLATGGVLPGCVTYDGDDDDWDVDVRASDVVGVMDAGEKLLRGPQPEFKVTLPRDGSGYRVAGTFTITSDEPPAHVDTETNATGDPPARVVGQSIPYDPPPSR